MCRTDDRMCLSSLNVTGLFGGSSCQIEIVRSVNSSAIVIIEGQTSCLRLERNLLNSLNDFFRLKTCAELLAVVSES
jgi:hypothetical protein